MKAVITSNTTKISKRYRNIARKMPQAIERGLEQLGAEAVALHYKTTSAWKKEKPTFAWQRTARGVKITTDSQIYAWVDQGTKGPYKIPTIPKVATDKKPWLIFRYPYTPSTKPRRIGSQASSRGDFWASKRQVTHPGIKARNFTDEIAKRVQKRAANVMRAELEKAINSEAVGI